MGKVTLAYLPTTYRELIDILYCQDSKDLSTDANAGESECEMLLDNLHTTMADYTLIRKMW